MSDKLKTLEPLFDSMPKMAYAERVVIEPGIKEAPMSLHNAWLELRKKEKPGESRLVLVEVNYQPTKQTVRKPKFDYQFPELAPEQYTEYLAKLDHFQRIADTMRAWGGTPEDKLMHAAFKAFIDSFGKNAVYYKRRIGQDEQAKAMGILSGLLIQGKCVVLFSDAETVPDHRFILMQKLGPWRNMRSMMANLKYPKPYLEFAKALEEGKPF